MIGKSLNAVVYRSHSETLKLLVAAKDDQITTIVLTDETGKLLVQTYGGEARVIR